MEALECCASDCDHGQAQERAALIQLEAQVINAACQNPGVNIAHSVMLPLIRERLLAKVPGIQQAAAEALAEVTPLLIM